MEILGIIGSIASILSLIWGINKFIINKSKNVNQKNSFFSIFNSGRIEQKNENVE